MLDKDFRKLIKITPLDNTISKSRDGKYYLFEDKRNNRYLIIVDNDERIGGVLDLGMDIQCVIFDKYQNKHYMSDLFRSNYFKTKFNHIKKLSIYEPEIKSMEDFNKKVYLAKLIKATIRNYDSAFRYAEELGERYKI